jgi:hypothetical protein
MEVEEAKVVCKDRQVERSDLCLPQWETGVMLCMYVTLHFVLLFL